MRRIGFSLKRRIYERLPHALQAPVEWIPFGLVAGAAYRTTLARDDQVERAPRDELLRYQAHLLGRMLEFATDQVPAYRPYASVVRRLPPHEALKAFPLLDKRTVQAHLGQYLPRDFARIPHYTCTTGATTGNQLVLYVEDDSHAIETAFIHRQWKRVGYHPSCRKATFRGVSFGKLKPGVYWRPNPIYRELQFSPFHINEKTLPAYLDALAAYQLEFLHGYPSALAALAAFIVRHPEHQGRVRVRAALLASEPLDEHQRSLIETAFSARAFSWYGHSERLILADECEHTSAYHHFPDYGVLELVAPDGEPLKHAGARGELVGTGLHNRVLPLIRYRTGDLARLLEPECACGRHFDRFDQVEGRTHEYVVGKNGSQITVTALNMHGPLFKNVLRYQYYQNRIGHLELRVVAAPGFSERDATAIESAYRAKVGQELSVAVRLVDNIALTPRGKLPRVVREAWVR